MKNIEDYEKEILILKAQVTQLKNGPKRLPFDSKGWINTPELGGGRYVIAGSTLANALVEAGYINGNVTIDRLDDIIAKLNTIKDWITYGDLQSK